MTETRWAEFVLSSPSLSAIVGSAAAAAAAGNDITETYSSTLKELGV